MSEEDVLNILLTNDDGINSPGLWAIAEKLVNIGNVTVSVPDRDQSGTGASMTLTEPVRMEKVRSLVTGVVDAYSIEGTPADCVIMGVEYICKGEVDLVVSGINEGANLGLDILNSGTFGAALHGYFRGINSVAISAKYLGEVIYGPAATIGVSVSQSLLERDGMDPLLINVNLPPQEFEEIKGVRSTTLGSKAYLENVEEFKNGRRTYYWIKHNRETELVSDESTDIWAVNNGYVSITSVNPYLLSGRDNKATNAIVQTAAMSIRQG